MSNPGKGKASQKDADEKKKKKGKDKSKDVSEVIETVEIVDEPEGPFLVLDEGAVSSIMSQLPHFMLFRSMRVSKLWNSAGRKVLLKELDLRTFYGHFEDEHLNMMVVRYPELHTVKIHAAPRITEKGMKYLAKLPNLTRLDLSNCRNLSDGALLKIPVPNIQKIVSLKLSHCGFSERALKLGILPNLTHLDLSYCDGLSNRFALHLAQYTPALAYLDISGSPSLGNDFMIGVAKLSTLKTLKTRYCAQMDHNAFLTLCDPAHAAPLNAAHSSHTSHANSSATSTGANTGNSNSEAPQFRPPSLTTLDVSHTLLNNDGLIKICKTFPELTQLSAAFCHRIDDEGTLELPVLRQLHTINLSYTGVTPHTLDHLKTLTHLDTLIVAGCRALKQQMGSFIRKNPQLHVVFKTTTLPTPH